MLQYREAFLHYLSAAEQGSKEGQASLAWLLTQGLALSSSPSSSSLSSSLSEWISWRTPVFLGRILAFLGRDDHTSRNGKSVDSMASGDGGDGGRRVQSLRGVVDAIREMGGNPEAMAKGYRLLAADQGDGDAR